MFNIILGSITKLKRIISRSLRYKLLLLVLLPGLLVMPVIFMLAGYWARQFTYNQLYHKVNTDLSVAHDIFVRIQEDYLAHLKSVAESYNFRVNLQDNDAEKLIQQMQVLKQTLGFDFIYITNPKGDWIYESDDRQAKGMSALSPLFQKALRQGVPARGVEIFQNARLEVADPELARLVNLTLVETPRAVPTSREVEDRAMVLHSIYPVKDLVGNVIAMLDGGVLLNRNFEFVDTIRDLVYGPGSLPEDGWGTVTVFLDDVRITTNVPMVEGDRALGTRVSKEVRKSVLEEGETWVNRAFVVNDWYISAYEPIIDVYGERVGMLYAGYLEAPYEAAYFKAMAVLICALLFGALAAALLAVRVAKSIFQPLEAITRVVRATQAGEERRIGTVASNDEIGELARQFDHMLDLLNQNRTQIQQAANELEVKVEERTKELKEKNIDLQNTIDLLEQTQQQLVLAEKLAALGELTAGVAHEINNPTAVILGNMDVLIKELGKNKKPVETEIDLIIKQVYRIRAIVDKLLQYSRPSLYVGYVEGVDINQLIEDTMLLVKHEISKKDIFVKKSFNASHLIAINRQELQQVLVNLILNAIHASSTKGVIELLTADHKNNGITLQIRDYGVGIPPEELGRVFDPFYTSNKANGTGLGLSVSYGLIQRYGGNITVNSEVGRWTQFDVYLHNEPN